MKKQNLIIITGPSAVGKTAVAKELCKKFKKSVRLDIDRVKHFVASGFDYSNGKIGREQWDLCTKNIIQLTQSYLKSGYTVIIEGVLMNNENWQKIFKEFKSKNKFLLLANKKTLQARNSQRNAQTKMLKKDIERLFVEFLKDFYLKNFEVVENNNLEATIKNIYKQIQNIV